MATFEEFNIGTLLVMVFSKSIHVTLNPLHSIFILDYFNFNCLLRTSFGFRVNRLVQSNSKVMSAGEFIRSFIEGIRKTEAVTM